MSTCFNLQSTTRATFLDETKSINEFIKTVFDKDNKLKPTQYTPVASKWNCSYCPFKNKKDLCPVGVSS